MVRARVRRFAGFVVGVLAAAGVAVAAQDAFAEPVLPKADDGATVVSRQQVGPRTIDLVIQSPALGAQGTVRLLVPEGWSQGDGRAWPTLWLLHGCCEAQDYKSWTGFTDVEQFTRDKPVIVVMPSAGKYGWYSDWWNYGLKSTPNWRQFHMEEVEQIVSRGFGASGRKSIAGLSMGAYGSLEYATRYPGRFGAIAAYSGAPDILALSTPELTELSMIQQGNLLPFSIWGDPILNRWRWHQHNPADKLDTLRGTPLFISGGSGDVGPMDPTGDQTLAVLLEKISTGNSKGFAAKAKAAGLDVTTDFYSPGTHRWVYWQRQLRVSWPMLAKGMGLQ